MIVLLGVEPWGDCFCRVRIPKKWDINCQTGLLQTHKAFWGRTSWLPSRLMTTGQRLKLQTEKLKSHWSHITAPAVGCQVAQLSCRISGTRDWLLQPSGQARKKTELVWTWFITASCFFLVLAAAYFAAKTVERKGLVEKELASDAFRRSPAVGLNTNRSGW